VVLTDRNVAGACRPALEGGLGGLRQDWIVLPPGEESKCLEQVRDLYGALLDLEVDRRTPILACGGGVVGDVAGFVAATLLRGLPFYQVPTTLLAMIDSSLGGKTGVDLPQGKNLVGAFYPARAIWADPETLRTLPRREWAAGMVEALKHAMLASPVLFETLEELSELPDPAMWSAEQTRDLVARAARVKRDVVARDPFEAGERALLNLGHTLGHALEKAGGFLRFTHGQAVGLGLLAAVRLARQRGILEEDLEACLQDLLRAWDLPLHIPTDLEWPVVLEAMRRDKKRVGGNLTFALPRRLGRVDLFGDVAEEEVRVVFLAMQRGAGGGGLA
jgi:3-dehydroquinate synthase